MNADQTIAVANAVGAKLGHPPGLRFFSDDYDLKMSYGPRAAEIEAKLVRVGGIRCLWPTAAGEIPPDEIVNEWVNQFKEKAPA